MATWGVLWESDPCVHVDPGCSAAFGGHGPRRAAEMAQRGAPVSSLDPFVRAAFDLAGLGGGARRGVAQKYAGNMPRVGWKGAERRYVPKGDTSEL